MLIKPPLLEKEVCTVKYCWTPVGPTSITEPTNLPTTFCRLAEIGV